ncbi:MAG: hydrogenase nickel incorporation protein HypB [Pseudomonadota bacterium]|jgi:hydrogenase nickel incorporation protein HypB|uniref:hydrogenase nickel incorporation protein HypB n=1 Tax=Marisediminitalea sp. TaxID=2662268 RepID=UPI002440DEC3|nr:hydrogenase nickel incorporation protein HypB [Aestuariibacter sp.]MEC8229644.1 hydrogenase nickel incorporation protein HypB [Pseudomonadota bacterium]MCP4234148.1 hydrogenase nickel incorporation protein HypB [Aestuariibacter sp.]MCP4527716.1 hydrogenase nickel incorporation protein HypB [Aestuariibacter sp.]MCP4945876.1 hydrogenase nickel incorporation protein HypB [Aestuariibacter sp.]
MCTVCGCSEGEVSIEHNHSHSHAHSHNHAHDHHGHHHTHHDGEHTHSHEHHHHEHDHAGIESEGDNIHFGKGPAHAHVAGLSQSRMVQIEQDILGKNNQYAAQNRARFAQQSMFVLNLVSSPGSGKTTLLTETINHIKSRYTVGVIEGDQQTANDADRIRETGVQAVQINTGKGCHLDAHMVGHAMENFSDLTGGVLFIENVGNLVCPASFDLGEAAKVSILSVTEGEDKPLKYPDMFHASELMILNKTDLLPYLDFDVERCIEYAKRVNPDIKIIQLSAKSGEGMDQWIDWISHKRTSIIESRIQILQQQIEQFKAIL